MEDPGGHLDGEEEVEEEVFFVNVLHEVEQYSDEELEKEI